jgi:DNA replication and repair protein RecF
MTMSSFNETHIFLKSIYIKNFRNIKEMELTFDKGHNLIVGPNGHGKTNYLEAISLACSLHPMQSLQNIDLIKCHEPQAKIIALFNEPYTTKIEIDIFSNGKKAKLNGQTLKKTSHLKKFTPMVSFIPAELDMVTGPASLRRRALDQAGIALSYEHIDILKSYEKILLHRNRLLKNWPIDKKTLATFTEMLIKVGAQLIFLRLKSIEEIINFFLEKVDIILGSKQKSNITYNLNDRFIRNCTVSDLMALLKKDQLAIEQMEFKRTVSLFGPHLDDMVFEINGINARKSASRGQSRAIVLSFKLAQMMAINKIRGSAPTIILDDIVSELDADKKSNLIQTIEQLQTQAFFSTADLLTFGKNIAKKNVFQIHNGFASKKNMNINSIEPQFGVS